MFKDRSEAGQLLVKRLMEYKGKKNAIVLAIPRGGVVVGYEVAKALCIPLDIIVIKKIGYPGDDELAIGAAGLDSYYINKDIAAGISEKYVQEQVMIKQVEVKRRYDFLKDGKAPCVKNKTVIVIDDGIATGATVKMAVEILRKQNPKKIIVAIPVGPPDAVESLRNAVDNVVCLEEPKDFMSIGEFYRNFAQIEDSEARELLKSYKKV